MGQLFRAPAYARRPVVIFGADAHTLRESYKIFPHGRPVAIAPALWEVTGSLPFPLKRKMVIHRLARAAGRTCRTRRAQRSGDDRRASVPARVRRRHVARARDVNHDPC